MVKNGKTLELSEKERKIIGKIRSIEFGELKVVVLNKEPVRIEEIVKSIKL